MFCSRRRRGPFMLIGRFLTCLPGRQGFCGSTSAAAPLDAAMGGVECRSGARGDRRAVQKWSAAPLCAGGALPQHSAVRKQSSCCPPARELQTVRIVCTRELMLPDMWKTLQHAPQETCRLLGCKPHKSEGWKFQRHEGFSALVGYMTFSGVGLLRERWGVCGSISP